VARKTPGKPADRGVYIISVAAELAGVHPQTLRIYERKGLLRPARTAGNTRRYSPADIERLKMIQDLTQVHGLNLAGVKMIVELEDELERMRRRVEAMDRELDRARRRLAEEVERLRRTTEPSEIVPLSLVKKVYDALEAGEREGRSRRGPIAVGPSSEQPE
jgi:MerR family transcriptional regulator/heat shock protein HspR